MTTGAENKKTGAENKPLYAVFAALLDNDTFFNDMSGRLNDRTGFKERAKEFAELDDDDLNTLLGLFERIRHLREIMFKIRC